METDDVLRELKKIEDALRWAYQHHTMQNRANAALHCNEDTFYSPLTTRLKSALQAVQGLQYDAEDGVADPQ